MAGFNPLAALAAQALANAQAAIDEATLSLGADVAVLQAQISVGDVIAAVVLAPQGGTDLLSFLGQTVPAQIPPGINPGETMLLQVTGFTNTAVIVRNLGTQDPQNPVPVVNVELPPQEPGAAQSAILTTIVPQESQQQEPTAPVAAQTSAPVVAQTSAPVVPQTNVPVQTTPVNAPPAQPPPPPPPATQTIARNNVAPPRELFVAASVRAKIPPQELNARALARELAEEAQELPAGGDSEVEARLALNRASSSPAAPPVWAQNAKTQSTQTQSAQTQNTQAQNAGAQNASQKTAPPSPRFPVAPPIIRQAAAEEEEQIVIQRPSVSSTPASAEAALLARLRVPITPVTLAAARVINTATQSVTASFERLESVLSKLVSEGDTQKGGTSALRSTLAFVSRFDLRNARALPEQIATFVTDVLDGAESKVAQAVRAWTQLAAPENAAQGESQQTQTAVQAQAAERVAAMEYDVKSAVLALIADSSRADSPAVLAALRDVLTATTALQLNVLSAQNGNPNAITIPLPAYFHEGGEPVTLHIERDAPNGKNAMDADNFHIAFILDTKSLGTVAIDLQTVGRSVSVDVKTQASSFANRFRDTLGDLRSRLEQLHYSVASIIAGVAPASGAKTEKSEPPQPAERRSFWDMRA
ncbi:MAG TPA: flagellar hook-length control protein FliK [Candidatus Acidoferrales bacterium]|nr:flagellar hook-length control protein FliK [Candidatus Acidoferrales bacterium]